MTMRMSSDERTLAILALRALAVRSVKDADSRRYAGLHNKQDREDLRQRARDSAALSIRLDTEPVPLLGAPITGGYTVIAALPLFPGSGIPDYIVAAYRPGEDKIAGFGTWRASCLPPQPWLFEAGQYFTAADETADAVRLAAQKAMRSLAERAGPGLCSSCGTPHGDICGRCA